MDSVFTGNNQGIEAGYGGPDITVSQSVLYRNTHQDRSKYADHRWTPISATVTTVALGAYVGHISANHLVLHENGDNVRNYDGSIPWSQETERSMSSNSLTNDADLGWSNVETSPDSPSLVNRCICCAARPGFNEGPDGLPLGLALQPVTLRDAKTTAISMAMDLWTSNDIDLFCAETHSAEPDLTYDFTGDGLVDDADRDEFILRVLEHDLRRLKPRRCIQLGRSRPSLRTRRIRGRYRRQLGLG